MAKKLGGGGLGINEIEKKQNYLGFLELPARQHHQSSAFATKINQIG